MFSRTGGSGRRFMRQQPFVAEAMFPGPDFSGKVPFLATPPDPGHRPHERITRRRVSMCPDFRPHVRTALPKQDSEASPAFCKIRDSMVSSVPVPPDMGLHTTLFRRRKYPDRTVRSLQRLTIHESLAAPLSFSATLFSLRRKKPFLKFSPSMRRNFRQPFRFWPRPLRPSLPSKV